MKFKSNVNDIKARMTKANETMLTAIGIAAVAHVKQQIQAMNLIDTGALLGSITYQVSEKAVYIGSDLSSEVYPIILEKNGNAYLEPGIMGNLLNLREVAKRNYKP